nr:hypothetical protein Itr_chr14CG13120 [Ipomoea trifida]
MNNTYDNRTNNIKDIPQERDEDQGRLYIARYHGEGASSVSKRQPRYHLLPMKRKEEGQHSIEARSPVQEEVSSQDPRRRSSTLTLSRQLGSPELV